MTQADAKRAVRHLERQVKELKISVAAFDGTSQSIINNLLDDIQDLLRQLYQRKPAAPNCRPVTAAELQALCASSNVVIFNPAA